MDDARRAERFRELGQLRLRVAELEAELGLDRSSPLPELTEGQEAAAYALVGAHAADFISVHDAAGTYLFVSPAVQAMVGWTAEQLRGTQAYDYFHPDDLDAIARTHAAQGSGEEQRVSYRIRCADGAFRWVETVSRSRVDEAGVQQIVCITRDVHDQKLAELRQSELLERLQDFASVAAHDLKSPIQKVVSRLDEVLDGAGHDLDAGHAGQLERAVADLLRMSELLDNLLLWSRLETEPPDLHRTDLGEVVAQVLEELSPELDACEAQVELGLLPTIAADRVLISMLVRNLVSNALKYRRDDATPRISIRAQRTNGDWRVEVEDNGRGIAEEEQARIFEMFTRLPGAGQTQGHGIGLALCQRIAAHHGGEMQVRSAPGQGATMVLRLPAA